MSWHRRSTTRGAVSGRWRLLLVGLVVVGTLSFAACGGDEAAAPPPAAPPPAEPAPAPPPAEPAPAPAETAPGEPAATDTTDSNVAVTDYVAYTGGTAGPADPSLAPIKIGWVNEEGGSLTGGGLTSTAAADFAVKYINENTGGIGGHPLELDKCFIKNAEEEGLACGQHFLNDDNINLIAYGSVAVGSDTIASTVAGQKPVIMAFAQNPSDQAHPNTYTLFGGGNFALYGWGSFGQDYLHAKTNAVLHPEAPGLTEIAQAVKEGSDAAGIKATIVGFDPNATDLIGALTAAGAQDADMVSPMIVGTQCLSFAKAVEQLGIDPSKVVGLFDCTIPSLQDGYTGGDYPKFYYGIAQGGDALVPDSPAGAAFLAALSQYGEEANATDPWYPATFSEILTIAQFMNAVGVDNLSPEAITDQVKNFKGPLALGPPIIQCGKYPKSPGVCADGDFFFMYEGNNQWTKLGDWYQTPIAIQEAHGAVPSTG